MKYTAALALVLAAIAVAKPMPAKGKGNNNKAAVAQQVSDAIDKWLQDIQAVNDFVDTAGQLDNNQDISDAAATALVAAQDEGVENDNLQKLVDLDASGLAAATDLLNQFNIIGPAIQDTVDNPQNLQKNLDAINGARYGQSVFIHPVLSALLDHYHTDNRTVDAHLPQAMVLSLRRVLFSSQPLALLVFRPTFLSFPMPARISLSKSLTRPATNGGWKFFQVGSELVSVTCCAGAENLPVKHCIHRTLKRIFTCLWPALLLHLVPYIGLLF